jgi:hypothetical protein
VEPLPAELVENLGVGPDSLSRTVATATGRLAGAAFSVTENATPAPTRALRTSLLRFWGAERHLEGGCWAETV